MMDASNTDLANTRRMLPASLASCSATWMPLLTVLMIAPACSGLDFGAGNDSVETVETSADGPDGDGDGDGEDGGDGDGDDQGEAPCLLECGLGTCVAIDEVEYCECPELSDWRADGCGECPVVAEAAHELALELVNFDGRFLVEGVLAPASEYDDANLWLENLSTGDRVWLGNTHDGQFAVRVTPGVYDLIYEVETPGPLLPHNHRVSLEKLALFEPLNHKDINIGVASLNGEILLNGVLPPASEYDDARILFLDEATGDEVLAGNTHDGSYEVQLVPGTYAIVYRLETPGTIVPHNDGAWLDIVLAQSGTQTQAIQLSSVPLYGEFTINGEAPPISEYDDANIELESLDAGIVRLGNTHDSFYEVQVIPDTSYRLVYRHESGQNVPQNQRARFGDSFEVIEAGMVDVDIPMVALSGGLTINGVLPPASEFDDGVLSLVGPGDDSVLLGNTHDGSYAVQLIPATYDVYYGQETAGGTVPYNKHARVLAELVVDQEAAGVNIDVQALTISGTFTLAGQAPPTSEYEDGRIYLRDAMTGDALLLGGTHDGGYAAIIVPGDYEIFYVQETGGELLPGNQNALLGGVSIAEPSTVNVDVPLVELSGQVTVDGGPAPMTASDGGQLYLRTPEGDSVLLGASFDPGYSASLIPGTYGVYYRSEASVSMPQNENGRVACVTIE